MKNIVSIKQILVLLFNILSKFSWIATYDGIWGNVLCDDGASGHDCILADSNTWQDDGSNANPCITSDVDGLATQHHTVCEVVIVGNDAHIGTYHHTILNGDAAGCHACQRVVYKHAAANLHLAAEVNLHRWHDIACGIELPVE